MTLADRIAEVLIDQGPMAECHIATAVRKRKDVVSAELEGNPDRFVHNGLKARASCWDLAPARPAVLALRSFDAGTLLALHPKWSQEWAEEVVGWLVDVGFAASVNGNGKVHATEAGERLSRALSLWAEGS